MTHQFTKHVLDELVTELAFCELTAQYAAVEGALVVECETDEDALEVHEHRGDYLAVVGEIQGERALQDVELVADLRVVVEVGEEH